MIVVVDERELVKDGYTSLFGREGVPSTGFHPSEFGDWVSTAADTDIDAVEHDIVELMDTLEADGAVRSELSQLAGPVPRPRDPTSAAILAAAPAPAEAEMARGAYRLPVVGRIVAGLGEVNDSGVRSRGITIAARPGGQVVAPAPGRVSFAGDYRGYGKIIIIDHGGGWTSLVTGMIALSAGVGDTLGSGTPIGRAGSEDSRITVELRRAGRPVDIAQMLG